MLPIHQLTVRNVEWVVLPLSGVNLHDNEKFVKLFTVGQGANAAERIIRRFGDQNTLDL